MTQHDVEDRLYKNTEVYNAIRADVETPTLKNLTNALEERIGMDKVMIYVASSLNLMGDMENQCPETMESGGNIVGDILEDVAVEVKQQGHTY